MVSSGAKTGRSPQVRRGCLGADVFDVFGLQDKRVVDEPSSTDHIWWGKVNIPLSEHSYTINRERALDYLNIQERLYVVDAFAGWDPDYRVKVSFSNLSWQKKK